MEVDPVAGAVLKENRAVHLTKESKLYLGALEMIGRLAFFVPSLGAVRLSQSSSVVYKFRYQNCRICSCLRFLIPLGLLGCLVRFGVPDQLVRLHSWLGGAQISG